MSYFKKLIDRQFKKYKLNLDPNDDHEDEDDESFSDLIVPSDENDINTLKKFINEDELNNFNLEFNLNENENYKKEFGIYLRQELNDSKAKLFIETGSKRVNNTNQQIFYNLEFI